MTDSKIIKVFVTCDRVPNMSNMVAVGQMGVDLYVYNERKKTINYVELVDLYLIIKL